MEMNIKPAMPSTLKKFKNILVRSKAADGKIIPIREASPMAIPKYPRGTSNILAMKEYAELSQLKKAEISQKEPS
jgi:hypothetical protein